MIFSTLIVHELVNPITLLIVFESLKGLFLSHIVNLYN